MRKIRLTRGQRQELAALPKRCDWCGKETFGVGAQFAQPAPGAGTLNVMALCDGCFSAFSIAGKVAKKLATTPPRDIDGKDAARRSELRGNGAAGAQPE